MKKTILLRLFALVAAMMCALGARAQEAYACYTSADSTLTFYYDTQRSSREGITYPLNQGTQDPGWVRNGTSQFSRVVFSPSFAAARPTTTCRWFSGMGNLKTIIGMNYLNTSEVIYMIRMFSECSSLKSLNVSNFNTAKATHMHYMFNKCSSLESLDVSGWNTANVTTMSYMFNNCGGLTSLNVSGWNTANVTDMECMFDNCGGLTSLDLSGWNTSNVTNMMYLFQNCSQLATIFASSQWSTESLINSGNVWLFYGCTSLVGGQGTTFHPNKVNADYAHIDGGPSNPGYFTAEGAQPWTPPEAYACYTPSNTTLTFYYDNQRNNRPGTTYSLNTSYSPPSWVRDQTCSDVMYVVFDSSFADARPTSTSRWFAGMSHLKSIVGMSYLNTSEVTDMSGMFEECKMMASLDLSHLNTANVTDMSCMFNGFSSDESSTLDLSNFNTDKVTDMLSMFGGCRGLTSLDLSSFNTSDVTNMQEMFYNCSNLTTIYVDDGWSTAAVTSSDNMFTYCTSLVGGKGTTYNANHVDAAYAHIDGGPSNPGYLSEKPKEAYVCYTPENTTLTFHFDSKRSRRTSTTYDLNTDRDAPQWIYEISHSVTHVVFDPSFAETSPTTTYFWFYDMPNLSSITGMENYLNTSEVTSTEYMFYNCSGLTSLDVSGFNTANVTRMDYMFYGCSGLTRLDVSSFNTSKVIYMSNMFKNCTGLTTLNLSSFNTSKVTLMRYMFQGCSGLTTIYVGDEWSTARVTLSNDMFTGCTSLVGGQGTTYNANHVDAAYAHVDGGTSNPGYFTFSTPPAAYAVYTSSNKVLTFYYDNLRSTRTGKTYDLNTGSSAPGWYNDNSNSYITHVVFDPSFAGARPTTTSFWFGYMSKLVSITGMEDYLNTSQVTNMRYMFYFCKLLENLDVSHFNTSQVTDMSDMFDRCIGLTTLDMTCFNTANVTNMSKMFYSCSGLTTLDLSSFNTANVTDMSSMFENCSALTTIYVDEWSKASLTSSSDMFYNCTSLVGGKGTTYNSSYVGGYYARIDGGPDNPGYFTAAGQTGGMRGDVDGDESVNIDDVTALIDYLLGTNSNINLQGADCDESGDISIDDVTTLIDYLLTSHW